MNDFLNNGPGKFDDYLKNKFDSYQPDVSPQVWDKMKFKLVKTNVSDFVSLKKLNRSFNTHSTYRAAKIKIWVSYAAAACLTVAFVFGSNYIYKRITTTPSEKIPVSGKTIIAPAKTELNIINKSADETAPEISNTGSNNILPTLKHNGIKPDVGNTNQVNQPVTNNNTLNNNVQAQNNQPEKTDTRTSLLDYIDRVNSKDKPAVNESDIQETPESIDINIDERDGVVTDETESYAYNLEIPNVITPNGDGYNDYFVIKNLDKYSGNTLTVANRNGKVVFEVINYQNNWDARTIETGTYYYVLTYKDNKQNKGVIKGTISVIR